MSNLVRIADDTETQVNFEQLRTQLKDELCMINGIYYCTIRGLARLLSINSSSLTDNRAQQNGTPHGVLHKIKYCLPEELPNSLKPVQGFDYTTQPQQDEAVIGKRLPEVVISCVIKYYAYDARVKKRQAVILDSLFSSLGVRTFFSTVYSGAPAEEFRQIEPEPKPVSSVNTVEVDNQVDLRAKAVVKALDVLEDTTKEYKEQALLTLLGII